MLKNCRETVSCHVSEYDVEHYGLTGWEITWIIWDRRKGALTSLEWTTQLGNATHHYYAELHIEIIGTNCWYLRKPGVFSGDWTKYSNFQLLTDSNFPVDWSEIIPDLLFFNETEWMLNEIENVNDTIVNFTRHSIIRMVQNKPLIAQLISSAAAKTEKKICCSLQDT